MKSILLVLPVVLGLVSSSYAQWYHECSFDGERHPHELACDRYYECRGNPQTCGSTIYLSRCPDGFFYNADINSCQPGPCNYPPAPTTPVPTPTTTTKDEEPIEPTEEPEDPTEEPTTRRTRPPFVCTKDGLFVDTQDCNIVHRCVCAVEPEFSNNDEDEPTNCEDTLQYCPVNSHFCEDPLGFCAPVGTCVCEADQRNVSSRLSRFFYN